MKESVFFTEAEGGAGDLGSIWKTETEPFKRGCPGSGESFLTLSEKIATIYEPSQIVRALSGTTQGEEAA